MKSILSIRLQETMREEKSIKSYAAPVLQSFNLRNKPTIAFVSATLCANFVFKHQLPSLNLLNANDANKI
jgi:hypothetical protein